MGTLSFSNQLPQNACRCFGVIFGAMLILQRHVEKFATCGQRPPAYGNLQRLDQSHGAQVWTGRYSVTKAAVLRLEEPTLERYVVSYQDPTRDVFAHVARNVGEFRGSCDVGRTHAMDMNRTYVAFRIHQRRVLRRDCAIVPQSDDCDFHDSVGPRRESGGLYIDNGKLLVPSHYASVVLES
jgi:hypothetical protein